MEKDLRSDNGNVNAVLSTGDTHIPENNFLK
jgi:hypothetical protein